jgi:hypothetical protein
MNSQSPTSQSPTGQSPTTQSPTTQAFRIIFRRMAIPFAEIAWRWSFAAAAWFLGTVYLLEYAGSLRVTNVERLMLGTNQPVLVLRAIRQIFEGSGFRFTRAGVLLAIALTLAWIVLSSLGRTATVRAIMEEFGIEVGPGQPVRRLVMSVIVLNFLRAAVSLAALVAGVGSTFFASSVWESTHAWVADVTRLCVGLICFTVLAWSVQNWVLSTAAIFVVTENRRAFDSVAATLQVFQERPAALVIPGIWFGLARFGAFIATFMAAFTALGTAGTLSGGAVLGMELALIICYCAVADFLYTGRLAAYVAIIGMGEAPERLTVKLFGAGVGSFGVGSSSVDRDELILSDRALPAT